MKRRHEAAKDFRTGGISSGPGGPVLTLAVLLGLICLFGGASRNDVLGQPIAQIVAVVIGGWSLVHLNWEEAKRLRVPIGIALLFVSLTAAQLIPLPPSFWTVLPGRELLAQIAVLGNFDQPWRPMSLTPDATADALFAWAVPISVLLASARVERSRWPLIVNVMLGLIGVSAVVGLLQITGRAPALYFYQITNRDAAVGLFANRNHQAVLLALALPLLTGLALEKDGRGESSGTRRLVAACGAVFLVPLILITGSRAGLMLTLVGGIGAWFIYLSERREIGADRARFAGRRPYRTLGFVLAGVAILLAVTIVMSRAEAVQRLFSQDVAQETRVRLFATLLKIGLSFAPFGAGFGSFDPVFRVYEPFSNLDPLYFNHAHNDLLEIFIEGGVVALVLVTAYLGWVLREAARVWRGRDRAHDGERKHARIGSIMIMMIMLASLSDYPLRTPMMAAFLALGTGLLTVGGGRRSPK